MLKQHQTISSLILAVLFGLAAVLSGCSGPIGEAPSIILNPPGPTIVVQPGEELAIAALPMGVEPQVTWTATCRTDKDCQVLQNTTGADNFFTAPNTPGEQVTVRATVKDKYDRENSATLTFEVQEPTPTPVPSPTPTDTPTPTPTELPVTDIPTPTPTATSTNTPTPTPTPDAVIVAPVNLRSGPGTVYDIISTLSPDQVLIVTGRNDDTTWWQVNTDQMQEGWVINQADLVSVTISPEQIPIVPTPTPPPSRCLITQPMDGDENLGYENDVRVTCSDVPDSLYIWILLYSHHDYNYYPQPGPIGSGSGDYEGMAYLGTPTGGIGDQFDIIVALADATVSERLQQDAAGYSGYEFALPDGVEEKDRITVRRGSFQDFEPDNGTPGPYFEGVWKMNCEFEYKEAYQGSRSLKCRAHWGEDDCPDCHGGTVRIYPSSDLIDLSPFKNISVWVYDAQGDNTVQLRLRDNSDALSNEVWSEMQAEQNNWTEITWSLSDFTGVDLSQIKNIELYEWWDGVYYFDAVSWQ